MVWNPKQTTIMDMQNIWAAMIKPNAASTAETILKGFSKSEID